LRRALTGTVAPHFYDNADVHIPMPPDVG
jgi:hypothetical protein